MQKAIIKGGESLSNTISLWNCKHIGYVPDIESQALADGMDCEILVYLKE